MERAEVSAPPPLGRRLGQEVPHPPRCHDAPVVDPTIATALVIIAVLTVLITAAMRSTMGWGGVAKGTGIYMLVVLGMVDVTVLVLLAVHVLAR